MQSRITKLAAAAVLALAVLLLARHLTGNEREGNPQERNTPVVQVPPRQEVTSPVVSVQEREQSRLAQELASARELFAKTDAAGLLQLLDTGLDPTKVAVASYLAQIGDESAVPALQRLADQWQGRVEDNPFRQSIERIRSALSGQEDAQTGKSAEGGPPSAPPAEDRRLVITVQVLEKATGAPIPQAAVRTFAHGGQWQTHSADDGGVFVLDLGESVPEHEVLIAVRAEGYVSQIVSFPEFDPRSLPKTIRFALERGTIIGGMVQDRNGRPIEGATVESHVSEPQQFDQPHVSVAISAKTDSQGQWRADNVPAQVEQFLLGISHPDFASGSFVTPRDLKLDDLRAEQAVTVLNKGVSVTGRVVDATGNPIAGADLLAGQDYFTYPWAKTDATGHFEFPNLKPQGQSFFLTVQTPGFVPQRRELPWEENLEPVEFVLEPAKLLIGRVVDSAGKPIADAYVGPEGWNGWRTVKWQGHTDPNGLFIWDYPPLDAIRIRIGKAGYRGLERDVVADDREQIFVLVKPMVIKGTVTDSETGERVNRIKVTPGFYQPQGNYPTWWTGESWERWFQEGQYSYTFSRAADAYAVRIEADGYLPAESRFVDANESEITIDIALVRGYGPSGYVFDANGTPVEGADVFWERIGITNGRVTGGADHNRVKTDRDGHFVFKPKNGMDPFLVLCDQGLGAASYDDLARDGFVTLTPWARVQGELRIGTMPAVSKPLQLIGENWIAEGIQRYVDETTTDEYGRFVFERVYPGEFHLLNQTYEVLPGQTLELRLGGTGRTVKGQLALPIPAEVPIRASLTLVSLHAPVPFDKYPKPPGYERMTADQVETWLDRFAQSAEGQVYAAWLERTYPQTGRNLRVEVDDRSTFHVDNVEPGTYVLRGFIHPVLNGAPRFNDIIGRLWHPFEVSPLARESELDIPLDLGTLTVLPGALTPGDPAPDFDVPAFNSGRIRLKDYRGKVLLLAFCDSDYDLTSGDLRDLKGIYGRFREDPCYAQVSLVYAPNPLLARKAAERAGVEWAQGLLEGLAVSTVYDIRTIPLYVLISPQGQVLATGRSVTPLTQVVEDALATAR